MRAAAVLGLGSSLRDLEPFRASKHEFEIGLPSSAEDLDAILIFGGDGTVHRHLGALVRLGLPVLVVPTGSGNDFARALGMRRRNDSLAAWQSFTASGANTRPIDLGMMRALPDSSGPMTDHYFACVAGVGLDADIARRAN